MRLTLRTMLAHLDEILEPADQQEIGQKIEESEFASDLVRRIRDVIQKLRLGAPALTGPRMSPDPNTVAEYLDNSLPAERVPEFERACLDSDVFLAEVAACHQILTLVLGHPAEVEPNSRQRMYGVLGAARGLEAGGVAGVVGPPAAAGPEVASAPELSPVAAPVPSRASRPKPQIPEYLRESSGSSLWRYAATVLVTVVLLCSAVLVVVGPRKLIRGLVGGPDRVAATDSVPAGGRAGTQPSQGIAAVDGTSGAGPAPSAPTSKPKPDVAESGPETAPPPNGTDLAATEPSLPGPGNAGPNAPPETTARPAAGSEQARADDRARQSAAADQGVAEHVPAAATADDSGLGQTGPSPQPAEPTHEGPKPDQPGVAPPAPPARGTVAQTPPEAAAPDASRTPDGTPPPDAAEAKPGPTAQPELGIFSNSEVLLKYDQRDGQWWRLPPRTPIAAGEKLLALPNFRPQVTLTSGSGVTLVMVGPAVVMLEAPDAESVAGVELLYGRIILLNTGRADNRLRLVLGSGRQQVQFGDVGATLAVELAHRHRAGANPETVPAPVIVQLSATSGQLHWRAAGAEPGTDMTAPGQWELSDGPLRRVADAGPPPAWIDAVALLGIELRAARSLDEELLLERPVRLVLQELVEGQRSGRRLEVRSLAARSSIHVGQFEPFVEALNDPEQRTWWPLLIESLEEALALGPQVATEIRQAFQRHRGTAAGDALFRLLWGYSADDLAAGADKQLVEYLEHDQLDFRLLALWNLIRSTGQGNPNRLLDPKASRQQLVRLWKDRLEEGRIVPNTASR